MGYLLQPSFHQSYMYDSQGYIASEQFYQLYQISTPQALLDQEYLYGILKVATKTTQLPTLIKYHDSQDGIAAWVEILAYYAHDCSFELRINKLDQLVTVPFNPHIAGGLVKYLDHFDCYMQELQVLEPQSYADQQKWCILLCNLQGQDTLHYLVQKCHDEVFWDYKTLLRYIRVNANFYD